MDLILASTSPYRRALLARLGLTFRTMPPAVDEEALKDPRLEPVALAERLARAKAESLSRDEPEAAIIGSDQLVAFEGQVLGKPGDRAGAVAMLSAFAGKNHALITSVAVWHAEGLHRHTDVTLLRMRPLSREEIERYVDADCPFDCAGSYKLEQRGIALFDRIESQDHTAITGLPLIALVSILRSMGFSIP